jgi:hypothetical protein
MCANTISNERRRSRRMHCCAPKFERIHTRKKSCFGM